MKPYQNKLSNKKIAIDRSSIPTPEFIADNQPEQEDKALLFAQWLDKQRNGGGETWDYFMQNIDTDVFQQILLQFNNYLESGK